MVAALLLFALSACGPGAVPVPRQEIPVACGTCIFKIEDSKGCYWAAEIGGAHYPVTGEMPLDHASHAPDGMCNMTRRAVVEGEIRGKVFAASSFELLPVAPTEVPADPQYTPKDIH